MHFLNQLDRTKIDTAVLSEVLPGLLQKSGYRQDLSVTFCGKSRIQTLNRKFRGQNQPTDILSFASGDLVIAPALAKLNARKYHNTLTGELLYLIIHGLCHLQGYDHADRQTTARMRQAEDKLLAYVQKKYNIHLTGRINAAA